MSPTRFLRKLEDRIRTFAEGTTEEADHPLVLRRRILDAVEDRAERRGGGAGGERLIVRILAVEEEPARTLEREFLTEDRLASEIRRHAEGAGLGGVEVRILRAPSPEWSGIERSGFHLEWQEPPARGSQASRTPGKVRLVVVRGAAASERFEFDAPSRLSLGRLPEVLDEQGHLVRRNDVVFLESDDAVNGTVSRAHASIRFDEASGEYRVEDEESACGTTIYRDGSPGLIPVRRRGVTLRNGDLLYLGQACVRVEFE